VVWVWVWESGGRGRLTVRACHSFDRPRRQRPDLIITTTTTQRANPTAAQQPPPTAPQDKCEPPIYVSDRRFMKSVQLLQVVAHADGRADANEYDALLLEHVFGNRPDDASKVRGLGRGCGLRVVLWVGVVECFERRGGLGVGGVDGEVGVAWLEL